MLKILWDSEESHIDEELYRADYDPLIHEQWTYTDSENQRSVAITMTSISSFR